MFEVFESVAINAINNSFAADVENDGDTMLVDFELRSVKTVLSIAN
jgi:hypothetical protein